MRRDSYCSQSAERDSTGESAVTVIVKLMGGLGNQLFQYAFGRRLSILHETPLKLDAGAFVSSHSRVYALRLFCIQEAFATPLEIARVKKRSGDLMGIRFRMAQKVMPYYRRSVLRESQLGPYDPNVLRAPSDVYLDGYWQSEKYFADIEDVIRREFVIKREPDMWNRDMAERIASTESVSIHVRRGDYVSDAETSRIHGACDLDYYCRCVRILAKRVVDPHFFVFSDDPQWVVQNLLLGYPTTFVTHNDAARGYEDLRLMSLCKHNIIANSSFSWWGAWLNPNLRKIVLAPRQWFRDPSIDTRDLIPDTWTSVPSDQVRNHQEQ